jgi:hypothetical protein
MKTLRFFALALGGLALGASFFGCNDELLIPAPLGGVGGSAGSTTASTTTSGSGGVGGGVSDPLRATVSGDITWTVTFDADAKLAGATDCTYTRHYEGVEDRSAPWLCPTCEVIFRADVQMTDGLDDCYAQVIGGPGMTSPLEWIGYGNGGFWRSSGFPMTEQGSAQINGPDVTTANSVADLDAPVGGKLGFEVTGQLTLADELGDPLNGFMPPDSYACGWPKSNPPAYDGNYQIVVGDTVPDGLFKDACDEVVRLHDLQGAYLLIDMSAMDCPPCQAMASQEEAFVASMAMQGVDVHVVTLLAPSLADTVGLTTTAMLDNWINSYGLSSPVLADRAWGLSMFVPLFGDMTAYPSWVLVDPELIVVSTGEGFGSYAEHETAILAHANP